MKLSHNLTDLFDNHAEIMATDAFNPAVSLVYSPAFRIAGCLFDLHTEEDPDQVIRLESQCQESGTFISYLATQFADHESVIDFVIQGSLDPRPRDVSPTSTEVTAMQSLGYTPAAIQAKQKLDETRAKAAAKETAALRQQYREVVRAELHAWFEHAISLEEVTTWWESLSNIQATGIIGALGVKLDNIPSESSPKAGKIQQHTIAEATQRGYAMSSGDPYKCAMYAKRADTHARLAELYTEMLEDVNQLFNTLLSEEGANPGMFTPDVAEAQSEITSV